MSLVKTNEQLVDATYALIDQTELILVAEQESLTKCDLWFKQQGVK